MLLINKISKIIVYSGVQFFAVDSGQCLLIMCCARYRYTFVGIDGSGQLFERKFGNETI